MNVIPYLLITAAIFLAAGCVTFGIFIWRGKPDTRQMQHMRERKR
jgi:hypothetical protein